MAPDRLVHRTSLAVSDLEDLVRYYQKEAHHAVALRLIDNAQAAFEQLVAMPKMGALVGLDELPYQDIRRWHINEFRHLLIFYREVADGIEVIRILHSSRDIPTLLKSGQ